GLDEPVVVQDRGVLLDALELALDYAEQGTQRLALRGIAQAVDRGQEPVEALGCEEAHCPISSSRTAAGLISKSSAGVTLREIESQRAPNAGTASGTRSAGGGSPV